MPAPYMGWLVGQGKNRDAGNTELKPSDTASGAARQFGTRDRLC